MTSAGSGLPAMTFSTVPTPLPTIGGGGGGGSGGGGFGPISLPVPRQDFTQAVNAARSVNRFKGDGATKPDHHLKNFEAVMQAAGILDQALWIIVFKTTLVDEATSFTDDLDEEGVTKWPELKDKFITRYRGAINPVMVMDNLAKVQHKKGEPVLAYINRFRTEAKWLPPEEANSPMVASLFLRNMQPTHVTPAVCSSSQGTAPWYNWTRVRSSKSNLIGRESRRSVLLLCHKSGHTFHQGCLEYAQKFVGYRTQRGQGGQNGNGVRRPAPGCKALTPVLEDSEEYQSTGSPEDDEKDVGDTPEVKVNSPRMENTAAPPRNRGRSRKDKAGPIRGNVWAEREKETQQFAQQIEDQQAEEEAPKSSMEPTGTFLQPESVQEQASFAGQTKQEWVVVEVDRVHEIIFRQIKDAKILLTINEITTLSPVSKEFIVSRLAGENWFRSNDRSRPHPGLNQQEQSRALAARRLQHPRKGHRYRVGVNVDVMSNQINGPDFVSTFTSNDKARSPWPMKTLVVGQSLTWGGKASDSVAQVQQAQSMEWDFVGGFTDEDENQFIDNQPYIVRLRKPSISDG
ncbi:hypothetical protein R1flu_010466 [Riccia fluitans]|uniref:Retrotransposon gag domain-containing protein n=1 Tax=Riccia fluitans TaxID=41844 RepID=A0ABD1Z661_9MARC